MNKYYKIIGVGLLTCLMSCSEQEVIEGQLQGNRITATAVSSGSTSVFSRLGFEDKKDGEGGVGITWADGDKFYMEGTNGAYASMAIEEGETGKKSALFTGGLQGGTLAENESIAAYYPSDAYDAEKKCFNVDLRNSTQNCSEGNEMSHLSASYYMVGSGKVVDEAVGVSFVGGTKVAMLRFDLTLPKQTASGLTIKEFLIVCDDLKTVGTMAPDGTFTSDETQEKHRQTVTLENLNASTTSETTFSVYINLLPVTFTGTMRLRAKLSDETVYCCDVNLTNVKLEANYRYYLVRAFLEEQKVGVDCSWYNSNSNASTFYINDEADLRGLAKLVNSNTVFKDKKILLMNNIDLKVDWIPIGYVDNGGGKNSFRGHFDGQNHIISGIYCDEDLITDIDCDAVGFFGVTMGATIENLTVKGVVKSNKQYVGGIVGRNINGDRALSLIKKCQNETYVSSTYNSDDGKGYIGGIIGYTWGASILECSNSGKLQAIDKDACLGGIVGGFSGQSSSNKIMACCNEGIMESSSANTRIGGIVAFFYEGRNYNVPLVACLNLTEKLVESEPAPTYVGGILGYVESAENRKHHVYGCFSISEPLFGQTTKTSIDESSCLVLNSDEMNTQDKADVLNAGILAWNTKADGVNGNMDNPHYCDYHFEVGTNGLNHLVIVQGAPTVSTETEGE